MLKASPNKASICARGVENGGPGIWPSVFVAALADDPRFENPRCLGTIGAIDLKVPDAGYLAGVGPALRAYFLKRGVLLRPLGNTLYVMPPYCIAPNDLAHVYETIREIPADISGA